MLYNFTNEILLERKDYIMNEIVENVVIDEELMNFNGPEDDSDDFDDDDFDLEIDSTIGSFDDFDDDEDF